MNEEFLSHLDKTVQSLLKWETSTIMLSLSTEVTSVPIPIDIIETLGAESGVTMRTKKAIRYWFPPSLLDQEQVVKLINRCCIEQGFKVSVFSSSTTKSLHRPLDKRVVVGCSRGVTAAPSKRVSDGTSRTDRPITNEEKCNFSISLYQCANSQRWYIRKFGNGCHHHNGHYKLLSTQVKARSSDVETDELERVMNQLKSNIPTNAIQTLLIQQTGINISAAQLRKLRKNCRSCIVMEGDSPAQRLISSLDENPDIEYVAYIAQVSTARDLLTIKKTRKKMDKNAAEVVENTEVDQFSQETTVPLKETPQSYAASIVKALSLDGNQQLLLGCCWMSRDQKRYFKMYPTVLGFDVTHGTNAEKRPLGRGVVITPDRKIVTVFNAFLPSEASWVFGWVFKTAVPLLVSNKTTLRGIFNIPTDQDEQCVGQVNAAIKERVIPNGNHRICCWHKVDRGYITKVRRLKRHGKDFIFVENCRDWFYSFTTDIDTEMKEEAHIKYFALWLQQEKSNVSKPLFRFTATFWEKSFKNNLYRMCFRHYKKIPGGDERSTSFTESANSSLKRDIMGPKPHQAIDSSQMAITDHEQRRIDRLQKDAMTKLTRKQYIGYYTDDTFELEDLKTSLSDHLVERAVDITVSQWEQSKKYVFYRIMNNKYLVQKRLPIADGAVTMYVNTSLVEVTKFDKNQSVVVCSCFHYVRKSIPCRHIYCVVDELPRPHHCGVRALKKYEAFYNKNASTQEFTNQCNELLLKKLRGPLLSVPLTTNANNDGTNSIPLKQFTTPLKQCVPINPVEDVKTDLEKERDEEAEAEMNEFGFLNMFQEDDDGGYDDAGDNASFEFDPNEAVSNAYTAIQPAFSECARLVTNQGGLAIANQHFSAMREELYRYTNNSSTKKIERKHNEFVSLPAIEKKKKYKRLAPYGSPSNR